MHKEIYENPLCGRYASREMQRIFSPDNKFSHLAQTLDRAG